MNQTPDEFLRIGEIISLFLCSSLEKIIVTGYRTLLLMYFFTVGPDEVRAWTVQVCPSAVKRELLVHEFFFHLPVLLFGFCLTI